MPGQESTPLNQSGASFTVQFGVHKSHGGGPPRVLAEHGTVPDDEVTVIKERNINGTSVQFNFDPNTRATRLMNDPDADLVAIMAALDAQAPLVAKPPAHFPIYADSFGATYGIAAQTFYDPHGAVPLFTFGGLPGVAGPGAPAFSMLTDTTENRAMTTRFQSMFRQEPEYPSVVTKADPKAMAPTPGNMYT